MIRSGLLDYEEKALPVLSDWLSEMSDIRETTKDPVFWSFVLASARVRGSEIGIGEYRMGRVGASPRNAYQSGSRSLKPPERRPLGNQDQLCAKQIASTSPSVLSCKG